MTCTCGDAWIGHPNPHALACPEHEPAPDEAARPRLALVAPDTQWRECFLCGKEEDQ